MFQMFQQIANWLESRRIYRENEGRVEIKELELVPLLKRGETILSEEEMIVRCQELGENLKYENAEYLLRHEGEIPHRWRDFIILLGGNDEINYDSHQTFLYFSTDGWCFDGMNISDPQYDHQYRLLRRRT